jgi:quinol monooxygenase YgiN
MIMATLRMQMEDEKDVIKALRMFSAHTRVQPGNVSCEILQQVEPPGCLIYVELWLDWDALKMHICSDTYGQILGVLELSTEAPQVEYRELGEPRGLTFVEAVRLAGDASSGNGRR